MWNHQKRANPYSQHAHPKSSTPKTFLLSLEKRVGVEWIPRVPYYPHYYPNTLSQNGAILLFFTLLFFKALRNHSRVTVGQCTPLKNCYPIPEQNFEKSQSPAWDTPTGKEPTPKQPVNKFTPKIFGPFKRFFGEKFVKLWMGCEPSMGSSQLLSNQPWIVTFYFFPLDCRYPEIPVFRVNSDVGSDRDKQTRAKSFKLKFQGMFL